MNQILYSNKNGKSHILRFPSERLLKDIHRQEYSKYTLMIKDTLAQIMSMTTTQDLKENKAPTQTQMGMLFIHKYCA